MKKFFSLAACTALLAGTSANAAVITLNYDLVATDWVLSYSAPGAPAANPVDPLHLNFTLTFDTAISTNGAATQGLVVNGFSLPYALSYTYDADLDDLYIGTEPYGTPGSFNYGCTQYRNDADVFCANISNASSTADAGVYFDDWAGTYWFSQSTPDHQWDAGAVSLTVSAPSVPEPASWALMIGGLGLVGAALRRGRQQSAALRFT